MERRCVLNSWSKEEVRAVIRYEWARGVSGTEIHNRLVEVYGPGVMSKQMVRRWCRTFSDGRQQVEEYRELDGRAWPLQMQMSGRWMTRLERTGVSPSMK
ncbi:HTH_48 domain-containing protein [Trichonephila clavata]|uniref:HTH_48 domain-containing protein n=1 Tax=Trichonephila clavata TaxID=2740835 RepID=A0A8X6H382_TRICU|nr:HTH_48 domain-containing protein [Trichonephila clavata]